MVQYKSLHVIFMASSMAKELHSIFASVLFISVPSALRFLAKFLASALCCRAVLSCELNRMRERSTQAGIFFMIMYSCGNEKSDVAASLDGPYKVVYIEY